jgi:site-specific recombinase XerD
MTLHISAVLDPFGDRRAWSRQYMDVVIKRYSALAGIHPAKRHYHVLKHSICVLLWQETHDLNAIQDHVGHRSSSSTLVYLRADAAQKAQNTIAGMSFNDAARSLAAHGDAL